MFSRGSCDPVARYLAVWPLQRSRRGTSAARISWTSRTPLWSSNWAPWLVRRSPARSGTMRSAAAKKVTFLNLCFGGWSWWNFVNLLCGDIESCDYDMHFNVLNLIWLYLFLFMLFQLVCAYSFGFFSVHSNKRLKLDNSSFGANLFFNPRLIEYFKFPIFCRKITITIFHDMFFPFSAGFLMKWFACSLRKFLGWITNYPAVIHIVDELPIKRSIYTSFSS